MFYFFYCIFCSFHINCNTTRLKLWRLTSRIKLSARCAIAFIAWFNFKYVILQLSSFQWSLIRFVFSFILFHHKYHFLCYGNYKLWPLKIDWMNAYKMQGKFSKCKTNGNCIESQYATHIFNLLKVNWWGQVAQSIVTIWWKVKKIINK